MSIAQSLVVLFQSTIYIRSDACVILICSRATNYIYKIFHNSFVTGKTPRLPAGRANQLRYSPNLPSNGVQFSLREGNIAILPKRGIIS